MGRRSSTDFGEAREIAAAFTAGGLAKKECLARYTAPPYAYSLSKVYGLAQEGGWSSNRKARSDKGTFRNPALTPGVLDLFRDLDLQSTRLNGKRLLSTGAARDQLRQLVPVVGDVSVASINRALRRTGTSPADMKQGSPAVQLRSLYPNHVHLVDASISVRWYFGEGGPLRQRDERQAHKPNHWRETRRHLIRWVLVDHCSGVVFPRYYFSAGENQIDLLDFLIAAWSTKPDQTRFPFHGAPAILYTDKGAAQMAQAPRRMLERLGIRLETHKAGNPQAKGAVEKAHDIWERYFEWQLLNHHVADIHALNELAMQWAIALNSSQIHSRHKQPRFDKWRSITPDQLRIIPPRAHCERLATTDPTERKVDHRLRISFDGSEYQLETPALPGRKVTVEHSPWNPGELIVATEYGESVPCRSIQLDAHGFDVLAPVIGERFARHPDTPAERVLKRGGRNRGGANGLADFKPVVPVARVDSVPMLPAKGREIIPAAPPMVAQTQAGEVFRRIRKDLGLERLTRLQHERVAQLIGDRAVLAEHEYAQILTQVRDAMAPGAEVFEISRFREAG